MNLITHFIVEIHDVEVKGVEGNDLVIADLTTNSWGCVKRSNHTFISIEAWEQARADGQFES